MENASKALLIAASILIVILLIALGMRVFNSTRGSTDSVETTMATTEMTTFNTKFTTYLGANKSKSEVIKLLNEVIANNAINTSHQVKINSSIDISGKMNVLGNNRFDIAIGSYSNGYIENNTIKKAGTDTTI